MESAEVSSRPRIRCRANRTRRARADCTADHDRRMEHDLQHPMAGRPIECLGRRPCPLAMRSRITPASLSSLWENTTAPGFDTYRVYANFMDPAAQLVAVYGLQDTALSIVSSGSFYQDPLGARSPRRPIRFCFRRSPMWSMTLGHHRFGRQHRFCGLHRRGLPSLRGRRRPDHRRRGGRSMVHPARSRANRSPMPTAACCWSIHHGRHRRLTINISIEQPTAAASKPWVSP